MNSTDEDSDDMLVVEPYVHECQTCRDQAAAAAALGRGTRDHPVPHVVIDTTSGPAARAEDVDANARRGDTARSAGGAAAAPDRLRPRIDPTALIARERHATAARVIQPAAHDHDGERDPVAVLRMWPASPRPAATMPAVARRIDDKVVLAHLALDLFRELGQLEASHGATLAPGEPACANPACEARIDALRGGLVEACLLVQRLVMMPATAAEAEARVHELLALIDR